MLSESYCDNLLIWLASVNILNSVTFYLKITAIFFSYCQGFQERHYCLFRTLCSYLFLSLYWTETEPMLEHSQVIGQQTVFVYRSVNHFQIKNTSAKNRTGDRWLSPKMPAFVISEMILKLFRTLLNTCFWTSSWQSLVVNK